MKYSCWISWHNVTPYIWSLYFIRVWSECRTKVVFSVSNGSQLTWNKAEKIKTVIEFDRFLVSQHNGNVWMNELKDGDYLVLWKWNKVSRCARMSVICSTEHQTRKPWRSSSRSHPQPHTFPNDPIQLFVQFNGAWNFHHKKRRKKTSSFDRIILSCLAVHKLK